MQLLFFMTVKQERPLIVAESVCRANDVLNLADDAQRLAGDGLGMLLPKFFLATIPREQWAPRVVVVRRARAAIGIVYAMERKLAGIRTGMIFGDARFGAIVSCRPEDWHTVWRTALTYLLSRKTTLGVRLAISFSEYEDYAGESIAGAAGAGASYRREHLSNAILPLTSTYESFLDGRGPRTRRNFRYYRRQFEKQGHVYEETLTAAEFRTAAFELTENSSMRETRKNIEFCTGLCLAADRPILAGLRTNCGKWLSVLGGWWNHGQPTVYLQQNRSREYRADSLSVVLRGYLLESLIGQGSSNVVFVHGVSGPLEQCSQRIPTICLYLDKPNLWFSLASALGVAARIMPRTLARHGDWIANLDPQSQISPLGESHASKTRI